MLKRNVKNDSETQSQMRQLLKQARQQTVGDGRQQAELMRQVRETKEQLHHQPLQERRSSQAPAQLSVGELVRVVALDAEAVVQRISGSNIELSLKGKVMRVSLSALEAYEPRRFAEAKKQTVVHGRGTGALRQAIRDLLAQHRAVTAFHAADNAQGGNAITEIELGN
ncbi:MAG: hypothetical protein B6I37_09195 [Desulfobacteraceae bacterium 4572_35.2]|nr:MAG: hypothetical protein B6I37_09195 [Desulfobacteraceae bacterium 4572_35.2]